MKNKLLEEMDYTDLIDEASRMTLDSLAKQAGIRSCSHDVIDLTIRWLKAKGKLKD